MPIRWRSIRRPSWAGCLGPERVDRLFGFFWNYLNRLNSNYDAAIVTNPALAERFAGFGLENIQIAPFGVERSKFSPSFSRRHRAARDAGDLRAGRRTPRC